MIGTNFTLSSRVLKTVFFLSLLILSVLKINAQVPSAQQKLDSLLLVNAQHPAKDSVKLVIYKEVYRQYMRLKDFEKAKEFVNKSISLAKGINQLRYEADAYFRYALFNHGFNNYQIAEQNYQKAIVCFKALNDTDLIAGTYLNLSALYMGVPDYTKALEVSQKAIEIYQKNGNDADLASCYVNVAGIYQDLNQQSNALIYLQRALKVFAKDKEGNRGLAVVYNSIGANFLNSSAVELNKMGVLPNQKFNKALEYLLKALKVAQDIKDNGVEGNVYKDLGLAYEGLGQKKLALDAYQKAITLTKIDDNKLDYTNCLLAISNYYLNEKEEEKASPYLLEALHIGQQNKFLDVQKNAYLRLSTVAEKQNNYNQALTYYRLYIQFRDMILDEEKGRDISKLQMQIDFAVKENDYKLKQQLTDIQLQRQVLLAKQQQQQLQLRKKELALASNQKIVQRLTFLTKQVELENEKENQSNKLKQQSIKSSLDKRIKDKQIELQLTELKFNKNLNLILVLLAVFLLVAALFVFDAKRKTQKLNEIVLQQKQQLEKLSLVKDKIFTVVSHDMRTPVNSIISFIQLLEGGYINQETLTKYAAQLKNTLGYTSAMMENLLNWASSQMQGFKPVIEKFDIQLCIQEVIIALQQAANQKHIYVENLVPSGTLCLADMNMSSLIIRNLLSNAIKFTPNRGSVKITAERNTESIIIHILDTGVGLSKMQLLNFNSPDVVSMTQTTRGTNKEKGTGIGIILCKTFIALMNGTLSAKSINEEGSVFTITLPRPLN